MDRKCRYCALRYGQVFLRKLSSSSVTRMFSSSVGYQYEKDAGKSTLLTGNLHL